MPCDVRMNGDELVLTQGTSLGRLVQAGLWFFAAGALAALSLLPFGSDPRDPYPWGACSVLWLLAAAASVPGLIVLKTSEGMTIDRKTGEIRQWRIRFGRRREKRRPLKAFDRLQITTYLAQHGRSGIIHRWYELDLRGPAETYRLNAWASLDREDSDQAAAKLTAFLKVPSVVLDKNPGDRL